MISLKYTADRHGTTLSQLLFLEEDESKTGRGESGKEKQPKFHKGGLSNVDIKVYKIQNAQRWLLKNDQRNGVSEPNDSATATLLASSTHEVTSLTVEHLGPSHTRRRSVCYRAARQRRYKILLFRPVCGVCAARQLLPSVVASRQKHATRGIGWILFLTTDA